LQSYGGLKSQDVKKSAMITDRRKFTNKYNIIELRTEIHIKNGMVWGS